MNKYQLDVVCGIGIEFETESARDNVDDVFDSALMNVQEQLCLVRGAMRIFITDLRLSFEGKELLDMQSRFRSLLDLTPRQQEEVALD